SKKRRSYKDSFEATFGIKPEDSYGRWRAEVTHDAIALERNAKENGMIREGELIARFDTEITGLALSPDGSKLMAILITDKTPGIRIWDLKAKPEPIKKKASKPEKPDPNEVEDRKPEFIEPKILATIGKRDGVLPRYAWWTSNNQITYEMRIRNAEGKLKSVFRMADLNTRTIKTVEKPTLTESSQFTWKDIDGIWNIVKKTPDGQEQQVTRVISAAWQPAPTPDGKALYYVQLTATGCEIRKLDLTLPPLEPAQSGISENLLVQGTVLSHPNTPSLLPPPSNEVIKVADYSVFDSHVTEFSDVNAVSSGPSSSSIMIGFTGHDLLNRLNWYAAGAAGSARGPRGGGVGISYRGWRVAPSLQAFYSLEKPSRQRYEPISGFDRDRTGAEFALTWQQLGMSPVILRPFVAWESVKSDIENTTSYNYNRYLAGAAAAFSTKKSKGDWGIGLNASFQGAVGHTIPLDTLDCGASEADANWQILKLQAGLRFITPMGNFRISAEEGRIQGDYSILDAFHFGGQNAEPVSDNLNLNRVQQPALPDYLLMGDRMRRLRAEYGFLAYLYFEKVSVWFSHDPSGDYQRIAGFEVRSDELFSSDMLNFLGLVPSLRIGVHRPLDGVIKGRTVFTAGLHLRF
ncbi:MAG: hypothetical protein LBH03_02990, partial [Holophagales bacterium]|nr:hypothetical protein [Holophagales bacterium]